MPDAPLLPCPRRADEGLLGGFSPALRSAAGDCGLSRDQKREIFHRLSDVFVWAKDALTAMHFEVCSAMRGGSTAAQRCSALGQAAKRLELIESVFETKRDVFEAWLQCECGLPDFYPVRSLFHDAAKAFDDRSRAAPDGSGSRSMAGFLTALRAARGNYADIERVMDEYPLQAVLGRGNLHLNARDFARAFETECAFENERSARVRFLPWIKLSEFLEELRRDSAAAMHGGNGQQQKIALHFETGSLPDIDIPYGFSALRSMIYQLISNACDALLTSEKTAGKILVSFSLAIVQGRPLWQIRVRDNGPGIDCARLGIAKIDQVFAEGVSSRGGGEGLAMVRRRVASLFPGGQVRIERTSPNGTTALLELPLQGDGG